MAKAQILGAIKGNGLNADVLRLVKAAEKGLMYGFDARCSVMKSTKEFSPHESRR